jgi:hypothetical protein
MEKIVLTEQELKEVVMNATQRVLNEMAEPLKKYVKRIENIRFQLAENWCLCKYCQLYSKDNPNFAHWITELRPCIQYLKFVDINNGIDKKRTLQRILVGQYDFNSADMIKRIIEDKFSDEKINDPAIISIVSDELANGINDLIEAISNNNITINSYVQTTFKQ